MKHMSAPSANNSEAKEWGGSLLTQRLRIILRWKIFAKMAGNLDGKIFAKIHHNYNRYITIEILSDYIFAILNIRKKIAKAFRRK